MGYKMNKSLDCTLAWHIFNTLIQTKGNKRAAMRILQVSQSSFYRRLKKYKITANRPARRIVWDSPDGIVISGPHRGENGN